MSEKQDGANLILRLYEIRREETMRKAREWFIADFHPESSKDVLGTLMGEHSADFRMVVSYWDMAAALVNHGAIDEQMFNDMNTEHVAVYAKLEPFIAEFRAMPGAPPYLYLAQVEKVVMRMPDAEERISAMRGYMKRRREVGDKRTGETRVNQDAV
ncbi:MAG TPA: hypothetical protein VE262_08550 [Blastocatellia bacterium]|nr:hypothetical protein [Blastocatellia bacterium]